MDRHENTAIQETRIDKIGSGAYRLGEHNIVRKDVAFQTVKSASIGAAFGAGVVYGIALLFNRQSSGVAQFNQGSNLFKIAGLCAGVFALLKGYESNRKTTYLNDRFDFLEKYRHSADPDGIVSQALHHTTPEIKRSSTEKILSDISFYMMLGSFINKPQSGAGNLFQKMAYLDGKIDSNIFDLGWVTSSMAWLGAHITNMEDSIKRQRKEFGHAEQLLQERSHAQVGGMKK